MPYSDISYHINMCIIVDITLGVIPYYIIVYCMSPCIKVCHMPYVVCVVESTIDVPHCVCGMYTRGMLTSAGFGSKRRQPPSCAHHVW